MKSEFREYFPLNDEEYKEIWSNGIVVLDTNVLLRMFRYKDKTANDFINMLTSISDRLWIPRQVAWEFHRRRNVKIDEAKKHYIDIIKCFQDCERLVANKISSTIDFCIDPVSSVDEKVGALISAITNGIKEIEKEYSAKTSVDYYNNLFLSIADLYEGRVGRGFSEEELADIFKEGIERYKNNIPPGFADLKDKKDNPHRELYGDLIIWKEILRESKDRGMPILFVTEDIKEDWWEGGRGKTVGPLPALRREFFSETGQIFHMYRVRTFIDQAGSMLNIRMDRESTEEINKRTSGDEQTFEATLVAEQDLSVPTKSYAEVAKYAIDSQLTFKEFTTAIPKINYNAEEVFDSYKKELLKIWIVTKKKRDECVTIGQEILSQNGFDFDDPEVVRFMRREARLDAELKKILKNMEVVGMNVEALR